MPSTRERVLERLRAAQRAHAEATLPQLSDAAIFANYPAREALLERFAEKLAGLRGEIFRVDNAKQAATRVQELLFSFSNQRKELCLCQAHPLVHEVLSHEPWLQERTRLIDSSLPHDLFARYECGVTVADFLIARTGSIVLNAESAGGRRLSVLPPLHIVLATSKQVVASLEDALARVDKATASYMAIITGPSRTSDIEKILVLGAHGPKRLAVIVIDN